MNKSAYFLVSMFLCLALPGRALDFGLVIQQTPEYTNLRGAGEGEPGYAGTYIPWVSADLGNAARLYLSAKLSTVYEAGEWKYGKPPLLFEAGRSSISWRPLSPLFLELGRLRFQEPSGLIATGLFDGLRGTLVLGKARLNAGAFYTGFLYKETAKIVMSSGDRERYVLPLDYADPKSYAASRRIMISAGAEFPDLTPRTSLALNGLAQFDLNGGDSSLHSQYFTITYTVLPKESLALTGTAAAGLMENQAGDVPAHFAAAAGINWEPPGALRDMARGEFRWSSGKVDERIGTFTPVTSNAQGQVFTPALSALMIARITYTARLIRDLSASAEGTYFFRTDGETLSGNPPSASRALGGELYGSLVWAPVSDFAVTAGGGAFFPGLGDVFETEAPVRWKVQAAIILSL
ncbi:MAG: hypothetical protein LBK02_01115 [Treponema sp.]|nr:hypothetical protein [Treponema sp.]